ncbi:MAG: protein kinase, partial [Geminicoccaceae bacterium]|nr:protein kinase [Geminicoccaceae bacterium]
MTPERWREIRASFDEIVDLDPGEQARRLRVVATADPELHAAVESLLAADACADERERRLTFEVIAEQRPWPNDESGPDPLGLTGRTISHFEVSVPLASGGMGVLYRAHDTRLNRDVALKFPWPWSLRDTTTRERFLREGRAAGALDHPNLCSIYGVGETDEGQLFLAMALYPGETLKARLERDGPLPIEDVIAIARQIARGIGAAHTAGIVHRDLKPANLMVLPDGTVKILDFGLAKADEPSLTGTGSRMGTVAYMAPEQVRGGGVDARADLWALGVTVYEMLTGRRPFDGEHDVGIAHGILHDEPAFPSSVRADVPPVLEDLVLQLLRKDPRRRTVSATDLEMALSDLTTGPPSASAGRVARFVRQARLHAGRVPPRAIVGAAVIVLISALMSLRSFSAASPPEPLTSNPQAQMFYDRGLEYERRAESTGNVGAAMKQYQRALELDSTFAHARARLALTHAATYSAGHDRRPARLEQVRVDAQAALALRPDLAIAHLAMVHYWDGRRDGPRALAALQRAMRTYNDEGKRDDRRSLAEIELTLQGLPNGAELYLALARLHRAEGRWEEAVGAYRRALDYRMQPRVAEELSFLYSSLRRYDEGIALLDLVIEMEPENHSAKLGKGYQVIRRDGTADTLDAMLKRIPAEWDEGGQGVWARVGLALVQRRPKEALDVLSETSSDWSFGKGAIVRLKLDVRAQVYEQLGDTVRARADHEAVRTALEDSVAAYPSDPWWHVLLGRAHAGLQRRSDAVREARLAMELLPVSKDAIVGPRIMATA